MDEVSSHVRLDLRACLFLIPGGRALVPIPEEKREPARDIDTAAVDSLKVSYPKRPIREADIALCPLSSKTWAPRIQLHH